MFITLEGIEGSGKTSQLNRLADWIRCSGISVTTTREPGGTPIGQAIRTILLDVGNTHLDPAAELCLYAADRAHHVAQVIQPALAKGEWVLCDRYVDATLAYQGWARKLGVERIEALHQLVVEGLMPDITFLFDLPVEVGLERAWAAVNIGDRDVSQTRFEAETREFHQRVRDGYLHLADRYTDRFRVIQADRDPEDVFQQLTEVLASELPTLADPPS